MAKNTFPNQRTVIIHRERVSSDFLGIKNENWQCASRTLGAHALRLYLYFAANADNYSLALSPAAIEAAIGIPRSTYHDQFRKLINYGYLVQRNGNQYDFYETPHTPDNKEQCTTTDGNIFDDYTTNEQQTTTVVQDCPQDDIEINNINIIDTNKYMQEKQVSPATSKEEFIF